MDFNADTMTMKGCEKLIRGIEEDRAKSQPAASPPNEPLTIGELRSEAKAGGYTNKLILDPQELKRLVPHWPADLYMQLARLKRLLPAGCQIVACGPNCGLIRDSFVTFLTSSERTILVWLDPFHADLSNSLVLRLDATHDDTDYFGTLHELLDGGQLRTRPVLGKAPARFPISQLEPPKPDPAATAAFMAAVTNRDCGRPMTAADKARMASIEAQIDLQRRMAGAESRIEIPQQ